MLGDGHAEQPGDAFVRRGRTHDAPDGVVTDLGIEVARWYRAQVPLPGRRASTVVPDRPVVGRIWLLSAVVGSFVGGAVLGATLTLRTSRWAMCFPAAAVVLASGFALYQGLPRQRARRTAHDRTVS